MSKIWFYAVNLLVVIAASVAFAGPVMATTQSTNLTAAYASTATTSPTRSVCTYLDRRHMDALVRAPMGTPVGAKPSRFDGNGEHYLQCAWSFGSRHGYLRLTYGPKAHAEFVQYSRYNPKLPGGPAGSTWADYLLHGVTTLQFYHSTYIEVSGAVGINASGTKLTPHGAAVLSSALRQVDYRLAH